MDEECQRKQKKIEQRTSILLKLWYCNRVKGLSEKDGPKTKTFSITGLCLSSSMGMIKCKTTKIYTRNKVIPCSWAIGDARLKSNQFLVFSGL